VCVVCVYGVCLCVVCVCVCVSSVCGVCGRLQTVGGEIENNMKERFNIQLGFC